MQPNVTKISFGKGKKVQRKFTLMQFVVNLVKSYTKTMMVWMNGGHILANYVNPNLLIIMMMYIMRVLPKGWKC